MDTDEHRWESERSDTTVHGCPRSGGQRTEVKLHCTKLRQIAPNCTKLHHRTIFYLEPLFSTKFETGATCPTGVFIRVDPSKSDHENKKNMNEIPKGKFGRPSKGTQETLRNMERGARNEQRGPQHNTLDFNNQ